jgi:hypothetical protein
MLGALLPSSASAASSVTITAEGEVKSLCEIANAVNATALNAPVSVSMQPNAGASPPSEVVRNFAVMCNAPFTVKLSSAYGGMERRTTHDGQALNAPLPVIGGQFASRIGYTVNTSIPTDAPAVGAATPVTLGCAADALNVATPCQTVSGTRTAAGPAATLGNASLSIRFDAPTQTLLAGTYVDTLTLTVSAQ